MTYAKNTKVAVSKTHGDIRALLLKYGANQVAFAEDVGNVQAATGMLAFRMSDRAVRIELSLPSQLEERFTHTPATLKARSDDAAMKSWEQACRSQWRALFLVIKAKLVAVETGITTFEREFMPDLVLPNGATAGQHLLGQIRAGNMPPLLPFYGNSSS